MAGYRSSINGVELREYNPPEDATIIICQNGDFRNLPDGRTDGQGIEACNLGANAARIMAEKYAKNEGRFIGCMDGLQQGLSYGYNSSSSPSAEMLRNAVAKFQGVTINSADASARREADGDTSSIADSEVIQLFKAAVDTGEAPTYIEAENRNAPTPRFNSSNYDGGYAKDENISGSFQEVYEAKWVERSEPFSQRVQARAVHRAHRSSYGPGNLCQGKDIVFDNEQITIWEYFKARGKYDFKRYNWDNGDRILKHFLKGGTGMLTQFGYDTLKDNVETVMETTEERIPKPRFNNDGTPALDANGQQIIDYETIRETRPVKKTLRKKEEYQEIYTQVFVRAYEKYYVSQYFGIGFFEGHRSGQTIGELAGGLIGQNVARETADEIAYNERYKQVAESAYMEQFYRNYNSQWDKIWFEFVTHAMIELKNYELFESIEDQILTRNEELSMNVDYVNYGLKGDNIFFESFGDIESARSFTVFAQPSQTKRGEHFSPIGYVSANARPGNSIRIGVSVFSKSELVTSLVTSKSGHYKIRSFAEIESTKIKLNELNGSGFIALKIVNPSPVARTAAGIRIDVNLGAFGQLAPSFQNPIEAGGSITVSVPFSGLDPLEIIKNQGIKASVTISMNNTTLDTADSSASIGDDKKRSIARYFDALVTDRNGSVPTGGDDAELRIAKVIELISDITDADIRNFNESRKDWSDPSDVQQTAIGHLGKLYLSSQAAGRIDGPAKTRYEALGLALDVKKDQVESFWGGERRAYQQALKIFTPSLDPKKKSWK